MQYSKKNNGFGLIEVVIAMAIVAILTSLAYPAYSSYLTRARRADGFSALQQFSGAMERYFTINGTYLGADEDDDNVGAPAVPGTFMKATAPLDGNEIYYNLTIQAATATSYTLRATPANAQSGDGIIEITHTGRRGWDRNNDGDTQDTGEDDWDS